MPRAERASAPPPPAAAADYEPAPNEIMQVSIMKPSADAKLGIRLAGEGRPKIVSIAPGGLAASAPVEVGDVRCRPTTPPHAHPPPGRPGLWSAPTPALTPSAPHPPV